MLTLTSVLTLFGFDPTVPTKLVRHQDVEWDLDQLYAHGHFDSYQRLQSREKFKGAERLVSFLARPGNHALFVGVYDVRGVKRGRPSMPRDFPHQKRRDWHFDYRLEKDPAFAELESRLVVDWGSGTRSWVQHLRGDSKKVVELRPTGLVTEWPGWAHIRLRHDELKKLIEQRDTHREWHRRLESMAALYLILDTKTGDQYVGSAYGANGLLGRWRTYSRAPHGGNKKLLQLATRRPRFAEDLQFAILQMLPLDSSPEEVIEHERRHKLKLGSRAHGLNSN